MRILIFTASISSLASVVLAANFPAIPADRTTPTQQRLAIAGPSSISVGWNTYAKLSQSCVDYGYSPTNLKHQTCNTDQKTYSTSRTWFHSVTLTGLKPATTVYYKIQARNSSIEHFLSPRPAGDPSPFNLDVVVDLGVYGKDGFTTKKRDAIPQIQPELNHSTIGDLARTVDRYDFVLHPGDFAYADDWYLKSGNLLQGRDAFQAILETFYNQLAPVSGRKPYMVSPGNHEAACAEIPVLSRTCPEGQRNFTDFLTRFGYSMPTAFASTSHDNTAAANAKLAASLSNPPFWYSFEYGLAHITMIDTETDFDNAPDQAGGSQKLNTGPFGAPGQQLRFLQADLASVDRARTPWLIVAGHRPWYTTGSTQCAPCQAAFEKIFYEHGVDVGVFRHVHNSQRFLPVYSMTIDPNGMNDPRYPMYIVAGGTGNIEGLSDIGDNFTANVFAYANDFSYARLLFQDRNNLGIEFYRSSTAALSSRILTFKRLGNEDVMEAKGVAPWTSVEP